MVFIYLKKTSYFSSSKSNLMEVHPHHEKASWFLLFPWSLLSIVIIVVFNSALSEWFGRNWSWITLVLVIPAAIFENLKVGFSTMQVMYLKILFSLASFMVVGITFGISLAGWYYAKFQNY